MSDRGPPLLQNLSRFRLVGSHNVRPLSAELKGLIQVISVWDVDAIVGWRLIA